MKIASYNIKSGGFNNYFSKSDLPEKLELIKAAIKEINADFIALIDTSHWRDIFSNDDLKSIFGYKEVFSIDLNDQSVSVSVGITVLTNLPVVSFEKKTIFDRDCIKSIVKDGSNILTIFSVYLDYRNEDERYLEVIDLLKEADRKSTLIIGDFNSLRPEDIAASRKKSKTFLFLLSLISFFIDVEGLLESVRKMLSDSRVITLLKSSGFSEAGNTTEFKPTMPTKIYTAFLPPIFRVDYIFHSPDISMVNYKVIKGKLFDKTSDHYPIACEVNL